MVHKNIASLGVILAAFVVLCVPSIASAETTRAETETTQPEYPNVSAAFDNTPIRDALKQLQDASGIKIVPDSTVNGNTGVSFEDISLENALAMVLYPAGLVYRYIEDGDYILVGNTDPNGPSFLMLSDTTRFECSHISPGRLVNMLPGRFRGYCTPDDPTHVVVITAPPLIIDRLFELFTKLDVQQRQIILRARIVEITEEFERDTGIDWNVVFASPDGAIASDRTGSGFFDSLTSTLGLTYTATADFTRRIDLALSLLAETRAASIIANPHITVIDNAQAEIKVITEEYFRVTRRRDELFTRGDIEKIPNGVTLRVKPRIGADGTITMHVQPEVSNVISRLEDNLPIVTRRTASTHVLVENGGTAVIGGLVSSIGSTEAQKTPGIGDAPLVGGLFRRDRAEEVQRQFLIFITPTILGEALPPQDLNIVEGGTIEVVLPPAAQDEAFRDEIRNILEPGSVEEGQ